ncbi:MAG: C4-type zinc ribbon domain-containing protein [Nitrospirota bacterium]
MPSEQIAISEELKSLIELQVIDTAIADLTRQKNRLPEIINEAKQFLTASQADLLNVKTSYDNLLKEKRTKEQAVEDEDAKIEKLKSRTPQIKTNEEYQALIREVDAAKKAKNTQEDALLVVLEKIEEVKNDLQAKEQKTKEEEKKFTAEESRIKADFTIVEDELNKLLKSRDEHGSRIGKDLLKRYTQLFESKNNLAVAAVKNGNCLGCHMNIPPQTLTEIKKNSKIIQCFNCSRILYWKD